jgi:diaminohydroxyphosphoribosylaminopyrimidine deaminase/5-amino-6-(5-phosphoribosylamino)uracil reductase
MALALDAARAVRGRTSPNPWVGAALLEGETVVAVGATAPPGGPHAEAAALAVAGDAARGATLFVTLEPCSPFPGKRTRPCCEAIVEAGVARVVIAIEDADPRVRGRGVAYLREHGVDVEVGDGADAATALLRPYLKHRATGLPYVIAKFAASLDGRIATRTGDSRWITGAAARGLVHEQRAIADAVLSGSGTVLADDPALTARPGGEHAERQPLRVILDGRGRLRREARLFREPGPILVATREGGDPAWMASLAAAGAQVVELEAGSGGEGVNLDQLLRALAERGVLSVWTEAGPSVLGALFDGGHVDELWAFLAPIVIGGAAPAAVAGEGAAFVRDAWRLRDLVVESLEGDMLVRGHVGEWSP